MEKLKINILSKTYYNKVKQKYLIKKNLMNSLCILLTDYQSINEELVLKSFNKIKKE